MEVKLFKIRDEGTFISGIAIRFSSEEEESEKYLLWRSGHHYTFDFIYFGSLNDMKLVHAPSEQSSRTTMKTAHEYIYSNWDTLISGQVIDIEYITGKSKVYKRSERNEVHNR